MTNVALTHNDFYLLRRLPRYVGRAYRAESGYTHDPGATAGDVVRHEQETLGNPLGVSQETLVVLDKAPAPAIVWVTRALADAQRYGDAMQVRLGRDARVVAEDGEDGYLVLRVGSLVPCLTDAQLVAYVTVWSSSPPGWPVSHRLYYYDWCSGWTYLTPAGRRVPPDTEALAAYEQRLNDWARQAAGHVMNILNDRTSKSEDYPLVRSIGSRWRSAGEGQQTG